MKNVWFFGSCFTWGFGCRPSFEYHAKYKTEEDKIWIERVSDHLNYNMVDKSIKMYATNFDILKSFILNIKNIKEGDIVIYEIMKPLGLLKLNNKKTKVQGISTYNLDWDKHWRDEEDKKIANEYIDLNVRGYDKAWVEYFKPQVENLAYILLDKNVKTYIWEYDVWELYSDDRFENIKDATNGVIDDYHYSWNGHIQMAEYIIDIVKKDKFVQHSLI